MEHTLHTHRGGVPRPGGAEDDGGKRDLGPGRNSHQRVTFGFVNVLYAVWHVSFLACRVCIGDFTFHQN